jgi:hypothetical protein
VIADVSPTATGPSHEPGVVVVVIVVVIEQSDNDNDNDNDPHSVPGISVTTSVLIAPVVPILSILLRRLEP